MSSEAVLRRLTPKEAEEWDRANAAGTFGGRERPVLFRSPVAALLFVAAIGAVVGFAGWYLATKHGASTSGAFWSVLVGAAIAVAGSFILDLVDRWRLSRYRAGKPPLSAAQMKLLFIVAAIGVLILSMTVIVLWLTYF